MKRPIPDFTEIIQVAEKKYYFSFRKQVTHRGLKYFVETSDGDELISIQMQQEKGRWKAKRPIPEWIKKIETQLSQAIEIRKSLNI